MTIDLLIKNGRIIDPARGIDRVEDVAVSKRHIAALPTEQFKPERTVDASGCLVLPGLIDFHTHIFYDGALTSARPDHMLSTGVTAAVDAGTCGCGTYEAFHNTVVVPGHVRVKSFLNVSSNGQSDESLPENIDPAFYNVHGIERELERHPGEILGLKLRLGRSLAQDKVPLLKSLELAGRLGIPLCVHVTDSPCTNAEIAESLRPEDVFCHLYHGRGTTILDDRGKVRPEIREARQRGVVFDLANGKSNFCHEVALKAIQDGFCPDVVSTDMTGGKLHFSPYCRSLPFVMSKLLCMGMDLTELVRATTETPARLMGMTGQIGTLAPGAFADIAVFSLENRRVEHRDCFNRLFAGDRLLLQKMTVSRGETVFSQADFNVDGAG